ncbi:MULTISPECIES: hypothetical protein [Tenacibaculum]|uniref:Uncharacterized protein n=2 Tax=Tenacibaculum TaxID=104267 RepID=A0AAE9SF87_9FLAO|nr:MULTISPECIES: hypothetical protein [Tenacibaculum]GFD83932.1 hypothetical protein KUL118_67940 [Tenacibaculum sp. KUL118]GFD97116.1 hypothetical protein KUL154_58490 [Alteromonas sp. KUL154]AZJ31824.1 hypothetical protein D6200_04275 [Tenacibaculum mesophilum]KAF9657932.1 hypothetical protein HBA12_11980 [Tenacibaculum mesophilum]MCO7185783.1 hypothetical protein [Tenacibaculum sp. XPcli2-G]
MKCLSIEMLAKYKLTLEEKTKILAGDPVKANYEKIDFGGPDTDGEEDCFVLPPSAEKDKCYDRKNNFKV